MRQITIFATLIVSSAIAFVGAEYLMRPDASIPPSVEAPNCEPGSSPRVGFIRRGYATHPAKVWQQGEALMADGIAQGRDLNRYDKLELAVPIFPEVNQRSAISSQARSFLWNHWRDHKRAYFMFTWHSVDRMGTSHIFIEPDQLGRWRIYERGLRANGVLEDWPTDYSMQWVTPGAADQPGTPLPERQQPDPLRNVLQFRDVCGNLDGGF